MADCFFAVHLGAKLEVVRDDAEASLEYVVRQSPPGGLVVQLLLHLLQPRFEIQHILRIIQARCVILHNNLPHRSSVVVVAKVTHGY